VVAGACAIAAALVATAFALCTLERWLARRAHHDLAWTLAFTLFAVAAASLAVGAWGGWNGPTFRLFYLTGAVLDVPVLALGTIYLLANRRTADACACGVALFATFGVGVLVSTPFTHALPVHRLAQGSDVFGPLPRALAGVASGGATVVIVAGALWSAWRLRRGPRVVGNVIIAMGVLVTGASGLLNSVAGAMTAFAVTLAVGVTIVFVGFLVASAGSSRSSAGELSRAALAVPAVVPYPTGHEEAPRRI
jgi:hypothetical protein